MCQLHQKPVPVWSGPGFAFHGLANGVGVVLPETVDDAGAENVVDRRSEAALLDARQHASRFLDLTQPTAGCRSKHDSIGEIGMALERAREFDLRNLQSDLWAWVRQIV